MSQTLKKIAVAGVLAIGFAVTTEPAEREQVRIVINLIAGVKMLFPENLRNNVARTERVQLDTNGSTLACLRLDDKVLGATNTLRLWEPALRCCASGTNRYRAYWSARSTSTSMT